jgi:hypothetical protein
VAGQRRPGCATSAARPTREAAQIGQIRDMANCDRHDPADGHHPTDPGSPIRRRARIDSVHEEIDVFD